MRIVINFDGGCKNNPGPAAFAYKISYEDKFLTGGGFSKTQLTTVQNGQVYFTSLREVSRTFPLKDLEIEIYSDSELVVKQLKGYTG